jgi:hypothetical protein
MRGTSGKAVLSLVMLLAVTVSLVPWKGQTENGTLQVTQTIGPIPTTTSAPSMGWQDYAIIFMIAVVILLALGLLRLWTILKHQK